MNASSFPNIRTSSYYNPNTSTFTIRSSSQLNYYKVLSLESENVSRDTIKKAFRSLALQCHPDVCRPSRKAECTRVFVELQKAYGTLSDPALREEYDYRIGLERKRGGRMMKREVWVDQFNGLRVRSNQRAGMKSPGCEV